MPADFPLGLPPSVPDQPSGQAGGAPAPVGDLETLTQAIRRGDSAAFSRFYDLYSFRLYRFLWVLSRGDDQEAREVCQTVFIKASQRLKVFRHEGQLWAWLCTLARNTFLDRCRARGRDRRLVPLEEWVPGREDPDSADERLAAHLQEAMAELPPEERELIQAAYVDGCPLQALADASGRTYKAIESQLARLRARLRGELLKRLRHEERSQP